VPAAQTTAEDTVLVFSSGNGNQISISDLDIGAAQAQVTLSVTNGTLTLNAPASELLDRYRGRRCQQCVHGTVANINAALDGLSFRADSELQRRGCLADHDERSGNRVPWNAYGHRHAQHHGHGQSTSSVNRCRGADHGRRHGPRLLERQRQPRFRSADLDIGAAQAQITLSVTNGTLTLNGTSVLSFLDRYRGPAMQHGVHWHRANINARSMA